MEIRQYASLFLRWWWLLVLGTVVAAASAFVVSKLQTPVYEATTTLLVNQAPNNSVADYTSILTSERLARTYSELLIQRPVLEETLKRLGLPLAAEDLAKVVTVELVRDTQLVTVSVDYPHPQTAAAIANALVQVFSEQNEARQTDRFAASKERLTSEIDSMRAQIDSTSAAIAAIGTPANEQATTRLAQLERDFAQYQQANASLVQTLEALRIAEAQSTSNVVQVEPAAVPEKPVRPRTLVNTLLAAVVGGMLAVGVVFLVEYLDDSLKSADDVQRALELPVLGAIAHVQRGNSVGSYALEHPRSPVAEAFRSLRTNIQFASVDRPLRTLAISSPAPEEGKSTVATNLAAALAQGGKQVILVDADLRRPRLHTLLGLPNRLGLSDLFVRTDLALPDVLQAGALPNLRVLTSGNLPPNPAELLGSERMSRLLAQLTELADIVVLDSPPALLVTDAALLGARADGLLLVAEAGRTRRDAAQAAVESLRRTGTKVLGVVLNNVPVRRGHYYSDYRYAYAYYDKPDAQPAVDAK